MRPFIENEVYEKTKRKGNLAEEAARVASGMSRSLASAMAQKAPPPSKQGKADAKKVWLILHWNIEYWTCNGLLKGQSGGIAIAEENVHGSNEVSALNLVEEERPWERGCPVLS